MSNFRLPRSSKFLRQGVTKYKLQTKSETQDYSLECNIEFLSFDKLYSSLYDINEMKSPVIFGVCPD